MSARPIVLGLGALALALLVVAVYVVWGGGPEERHAEEEADAGVAPAVIDEPEPPAPEPVLTRAAIGEPPHRPNLILVTVDTVRADHLSTYGYYRDTSDGLTQLAENGAIFTHAYSTSSWTSPSLASTLSSVLPSEHGVLAAAFHADGSATIDALPEAVPSLPRALSAAGYRTMGITANGRLLSQFGYATGFDTYRCLGFETVDVLERAVMEVTGELVADERPFFLWVHVLDPHSPYLPATDRPRYWTGEPRPELDAMGIPQALPVILRRRPTQDDVDYLIASYDDELRRSFDFVHRLIGALDDEPFVALVTSDHGEEFGDHHGMGHGHTLFEEVVHVPWVLIAPGYLSRTEIPTEVSSIDILPTFVELAGAPPVDGARGQSVVPLLRGESIPARDIILETGRGTMVVHGIVRDRIKYGVLLSPAEIDRMFDLRSDPDEEHNLTSARTDVARAMRERLDRELADAASRRPTSGAPLTLGPADIEQLRELGYLHDPVEH